MVIEIWLLLVVKEIWNLPWAIDFNFAMIIEIWTIPVYRDLNFANDYKNLYCAYGYRNLNLPKITEIGTIPMIKEIWTFLGI